MDTLNLLKTLIGDYTLQTIIMGTLCLGLVSGALGTFAVLRRQSLLGDAMSHAALPGVVGAFILTGQKSAFVLVIGAAVAGIVGVLVLITVTRYTRVKEDSALGIILAVFFGLGLLLLTWLQRNPDSNQAGLNAFLFGQAATLLRQHVLVMALFGGLALLVLALFWKEFKLLTYDRDFGASLGLPMQALEILLTVLLVIAIVIGLQAVGVVLMSAMVVAPAAAARQWTNRLGRMVFLSAGFGALAGVSGSIISATGQRLSTGPLIVLCASVLVVVSLLLAPGRGLVWHHLQRRRQRRRLQQEQILAALYQLAQAHGDPTYPHPAQMLQLMGMNLRTLHTTLAKLAEQGWVQAGPQDTWSLTPAGVEAARQALHVIGGGNLYPEALYADDPRAGASPAINPAGTASHPTRVSSQESKL